VCTSILLHKQGRSSQHSGVAVQFKQSTIHPIASAPASQVTCRSSSRAIPFQLLLVTVLSLSLDVHITCSDLYMDTIIPWSSFNHQTPFTVHTVPLAISKFLLKFTKFQY